jgi:DNA helicase II / ATP-dependent DNA helicase PcrA
MFEQVDSERASFIERLIIATELIQQKSYPNGIKELVKQIMKSTKGDTPLIRNPYMLNEQEARGIAISLIEFMTTKYDLIKNESLNNIYQKIVDYFPKIMPNLKLKQLIKGKPKTFAETVSYQDLSNCIRLPDEGRKIRTIHQAKSTEFNNVLVCVKRDDKDQLEYIINPRSFTKEDAKEEKRIIYVALSRAKDNLFIHVPTLTSDEEAQLKVLKLEIVRT